MHDAVIPGDIYIYQVPFVDGAQIKPRPVLVTSFPNKKGDVQGIPGSSRIEQWDEPYQIIVTGADLERGTLPKPTVFPASKQMVFSPQFFRGKVGSLKTACLDAALRHVVARQTEQFSKAIHVSRAFEPGVSVIPPSGKVIGVKETQNMVEAAFDGWLTTGRFNDAFEKKLEEFLGVKHVLTTTSGSSANLLAVSALTSPLLGEKALKAGDEVITVAAGKAHAFLCMLAYYVEWQMKQKLAPLLFAEEDWKGTTKKRKDIASPAVSSDATQKKDCTHRTSDDLPVQTRSTPFQQKALDLLGIALHP